MKRIIFIVLIWILSIVGEVMCIVKMIKCNWEPIGKAEVIYTIGVFTGTGVVIGYLDIEDK